MKLVFHILAYILGSLNILAQTPKLMLPVGHTRMINTIEFSPKCKDDPNGGKKILTTSRDRTVKIWDVNSGKLLIDIPNVSFGIFSYDGRNIITKYKGLIEIRDAKFGYIKSRIQEKNTSFNFVKLSPDGLRVLTVGMDSTCKIWDAVTGDLLIDLCKPVFGVNYAEFSPKCIADPNGGEMVLTTSEDCTVKVWNSRDGRLLYQIKGQENCFSYYFKSHFLENGKEILIKDENNITYWDIKKRILIKTTKIKEVDSVNFSQFKIEFNDDEKISYLRRSWEYGYLLYKGKGDSTFEIFLNRFLKENSGKLIESPDGKIVARVVWHRVYFWDAHTHKSIGMTNFSNVGVIAFSPDGKKIAVSFEDTKCFVLETKSLLRLSTLGGAVNNNSVQISNNSDKLLYSSYDRDSTRISIRDLNFDKVSQNLNSISGYSSFTKFYDNDKKVINFTDSSINILDAENGKYLFKLGEVVNPLKKTELYYTISVSPDNKKIIGRSDDTIRIWNAENGKILASKKIESTWNTIPQFCPIASQGAESSKIIYLTSNGEVQMWNCSLDTMLGKIDKIFNDTVHNNNYIYYRLAKFSEDGKYIITNRSDNTVQFWDSNRLGFQFELKGHTNTIKDVIQRNNLVLSYSHDNTCNIWNTKGVLLKTLIGHTNGVEFGDIYPDSNRIISSGFDRTTKIWNIATGEIITDIPNATLQSLSFKNHLFAAKNDDELSFYSTETGKKLYSYYSIGSNDYVVTDTEGRFDGTQNGMKQMYYVYGDEIVELDQIKDQCWEPGLVGKIMGVNKEPIIAKKMSQVEICGIIPKVRDLGIVRNEFIFEIEKQKGGIGEIVVYVNDKSVISYAIKDLSRLKENIFQLKIPRSRIEQYFVGGRNNKISIKAYTSDGSKISRGSEIIDNEIREITIPNVYILSVGINKYKSENLGLNYAASDAESFSNVIKKVSRKMLNIDTKEHVFSYSLLAKVGSTKWPTKLEIKNTFLEIAKQAKSDDIFVFFFAGHGVISSINKKFYFLTAEASNTEIEGIENDIAISSAEIDEWTKEIKAAKQILVFDACNTGKGVNEMEKLIAARELPSQQIKILERLKERSGCYILAASAENQSAYESTTLGHGLLTFSLLQTIKDGTALREQRYLDISTWFNTSVDRASDLAKNIGGRQTPRLIGRASFDIGQIDENIISSIDIGSSNTFFTKSTFLNEISINDDLDIGKQMDMELRNFKSRGDKLKSVCFSEMSTDNTYKINGKYRMEGNIIYLDVAIFHGISKLPITKFKIDGEIDKINEVYKKILQEVSLTLKNRIE